MRVAIGISGTGEFPEDLRKGLEKIESRHQEINSRKKKIEDSAFSQFKNREPIRSPQERDDETASQKEFIESGTKIFPTPPKTPKDRRRALGITAKLKSKLAQLKEQKTAQTHGHSIIFKKHDKGAYRSASLDSQRGKYAKYWLLNAKQTNGNGWGIAAHSAKANMAKFIGRPLVITSSKWHGASVYGEKYEHPYVPTNDLNQIFAHQEKFRVGTIVDIGESGGDYHATIEMLPKFANMTLPPFCSPAIYQLDAQEAEGQISKWEALHLAALDENPAYGARIALLKGTCVGTNSECKIQFRGAKLRKANIFETSKKLGTMKDLGKRMNKYEGGYLGTEQSSENFKHMTEKDRETEGGEVRSHFIQGTKINPTGSKINTSLKKKLAKIKLAVEDPNTAGMSPSQRKQYDKILSDISKRRGEMVNKNIEFIKKNPKLTKHVKFDPSSLAKLKGRRGKPEEKEQDDKDEEQAVDNDRNFYASIACPIQVNAIREKLANIFDEKEMNRDKGSSASISDYGKDGHGRGLSKNPDLLKNKKKLKGKLAAKLKGDKLKTQKSLDEGFFKSFKSRPNELNSDPEFVDIHKRMSETTFKNDRKKYLEGLQKNQKVAFEFVDDDVGKNEREFASNIPNNLLNRINRVNKLRKTLPLSRETDFSIAREKHEDEFIDTGKPIRPSKRFRNKVFHFDDGSMLGGEGNRQNGNIVNFDNETKKKLAKLKQKVAVKLISDEQVRALRERLGPNDSFPDDGMKRSPADSRRNFNIQTRAIAREKLDSLTSLTRRGNPKTPLIDKVPFGKERRPKKNSIGQSLQDEDRQDEFLALDFTNELNPISSPPKPRQQDRTRIIQAKLNKLKQKVALDLTENVKFQMNNFMKRPEKQKTRFEKELFGDMLATNSKDKMQLLTNLESTRDDKILRRDEEGTIIDSLGDTRGSALVHSFDRKPHGITSPIDKGEQEYQQTKLLMKKTADGRGSNLTQDQATQTLNDVERGNARKSRTPISAAHKFKISKLKLKIASMGEQNMTFQDSKKVKIIKKKHPEVRKAKAGAIEFPHDDIEGALRKIHASPLPTNERAQQSSFLSSDGDFIGGGEDHTETIKSIFPGKTFTQEDKGNDGPVTRFSIEHGLPRVQRRITRRGGRVSFGIHSKLSRTQLNSILDLEKGNEEIGFVVGPDVNGTTGEGGKDLVKALRAHGWL